MITEMDLQEAIAECKGTRNPNANTCIKLAAYYTILDHEQRNSEPEVIPPRYSYASGYSSKSEFGETVQTLDQNEVMSVMDELMDTIKILNPRLYDAVMRKLRGT